MKINSEQYALIREELPDGPFSVDPINLTLLDIPANSKARAVLFGKQDSLPGTPLARLERHVYMGGDYHDMQAFERLTDFLGQYEFASKSPTPDWSVVDAAFSKVCK